MGKIEGGCLCGSVRYSSEAEPIVTAVCHCADCQKQTGTAFSIVVGVPAEGFEVEGELSRYETTGDDTHQPTDRRFCSKCGSPIYSSSGASPGVLYLKAGTLDDSSWLRPQAHVWTASAQAWVDVPEGPATFKRSPQAPAAG